MAEENRRSFMRWAIHGLSAIFTAIIGFPAIMYLVDARNRRMREKSFRVVDGINLADLNVGQVRQGVIRDVRRDAWTLHPNDVIGRVWVYKHGPGRMDLHVFTTVCPHLGCSINLTTSGAQPTGFLCPCHNGQFNLDGSKVEGEIANPAPRGMDKLIFRIEDNRPNQLLVEYLNFKQLETESIVKT